MMNNQHNQNAAGLAQSEHQDVVQKTVIVVGRRL